MNKWYDGLEEKKLSFQFRRNHCFDCENQFTMQGTDSSIYYCPYCGKRLDYSKKN